MFPAFQQFRAQVNQAKGVDPFVGTLIALDPGETTGVAIFEVTGNQVTLEQLQLKTWPFEEGYKSLLQLFHMYPPIVVVHESYRVYEWKAQHHSWSDVPTLQIIGCAKAVLLMKCPYGVPVFEQTAQVAKNFCTDERLKSWGMYNASLRHARDAVRHGCYFLLFGPSERQS